MTLLADESVEFPIVLRVRDAGFDCVSLHESGPVSTDEEVLKRAGQRDFIIITADKDFSIFVNQHELCIAGVVLLRLQEINLVHAAEEFASAMTLKTSDLNGNFWVISPGHIRIRPFGCEPEYIFDEE